MNLLINVFILCWVQVAVETPFGCEDQVIPLDPNNRTPIFGIWFLLTGVSDLKDYISTLKTRQSFWMKLCSTPENGTVALNAAVRINGTCEFISEKPMITNNTLIFGSDPSQDRVHLYSCPKCLIVTFSKTENGLTSHFLLLWGRTRTPSTSDLETYKRYVECFGLGSPEFIDPQEDLCPDERNSSAQKFVDHQSGLSFVDGATSVSCKNLLRPLVLADLTQIFGKWFFIYGTGGYSSITKNYKSIDSMWMELSSTSQNNTALVFNAMRKHDTCHFFTSKANIFNNTLNFDHGSGRDRLYLLTCLDCLIMVGNLNVQGKTIQSMQVWGRNRTLSAIDMDTSNRSVECLGLEQPVYINPEKDLCPDERKP